MTIRVGVAGVAGMGLFHVLSFGRHEGAEVTAICDPWEKALEGAAGGVPDAQRFTDLGEMCGSGAIDAIVIATPNAMHADNVSTALRAGLHVYCEKPLGVTLGECRRLADLADETGRCLQIGFQHRFQHGYATAHRLVTSGEIGPLRRADMHATDWFRPNVYFAKRPWRASWEQAGGGVLMLQAIHQLDAYLWICGSPEAVQARAWSGRSGVEVEDDLYAILEFGGGGRGMLSASTLMPVGTNHLEITGDAGALRVEGEKISRASWDGNTSQILQERTNLYEALPVTWADLEPDGDAMTYDECVVACQRDFLDAIAGGGRCLIDGREAARSVEVANAVYLSALLDERIELPLDPAVYDEAFGRMRAGDLRLQER